MLPVAARQRDVESASTALACIKLKYTPRLLEGNGVIPGADDHDHAAHSLHGIGERTDPPLKRFCTRVVLAVAEQFKPHARVR